MLDGHVNLHRIAVDEPMNEHGRKCSVCGAKAFRVVGTAWAFSSVLTTMPVESRGYDSALRGNFGAYA
jgi:hypothetical protein